MITRPQGPARLASFDRSAAAPSRVSGGHPVSTGSDASAFRHVQRWSWSAPATTAAAVRPAERSRNSIQPAGRRSQRPSHPPVVIPDTVANLLWTSSTRIVTRPVQMKATMPDKRHVGSFVVTTIGAATANDNPFRARPSPTSVVFASIHALLRGCATNSAQGSSSMRRAAGQYSRRPSADKATTPSCKSRIASIKATGSAGS